jgi:hypothetical protein
LVVPSRCCCGCTLLSDTFNRSGAEIGPDGVSPTGIDNRYFFSSGSWTIDANKLKCVTSGEELLFFSHSHCDCNTDVRPQISATLSSLGDWAEVSNGTETVRVEIINGPTGSRSLATTFGGMTTYAYGNSAGTTNISLPQNPILSIQLFHCDPEQPNWNVQLCAGQNGCDGPDYARSSPFTQTISTTITNAYEWSLKAKAGVTFDNLTVNRNTDPCTSEPSVLCNEICCGDFPASIELTISGFDHDCEAPCCSNREAYDDCRAQCEQDRIDAYAVLDANKWDWYWSHGMTFVGYNICELQEPVEQAYVSCMCDCLSHWDCKPIGTCASTLNGTHIFEQWMEPVGSSLSPPTNTGCRYYFAMIPVSAFWQVKSDASMGGQYANDCSNLEGVSDRYLYAHITMSYRFYSSGSPKRSQVSYQLWLPTNPYPGGFSSGQRSWFAANDPSKGGMFVDSSTWCGGGDMALDAPSEYADTWDMNTVLTRPAAPTIFYAVPPGFGTTRPMDSLTCGQLPPLGCGASVPPCQWAASETTDPETLETTINYESYDFDLPDQTGLACPQSTHVQLTLTLESMGV